MFALKYQITIFWNLANVKMVFFLKWKCKKDFFHSFWEMEIFLEWLSGWRERIEKVFWETSDFVSESVSQALLESVNYLKVVNRLQRVETWNLTILESKQKFPNHRFKIKEEENLRFKFDLNMTLWFGHIGNQGSVSWK